MYPVAAQADDDVESGGGKPLRKARRKAMPNTPGEGYMTLTGMAYGDTSLLKDAGNCRNQTGYIGVRQRKWGMYAAEIRDGDKRRWGPQAGAVHNMQDVQSCMHGWPQQAVQMPMCLNLSTSFPSSTATCCRWLGSFPTGREAGLAYDAAAIAQKGTKAKTNFQYRDTITVPRPNAELEDSVRWDLLPKEIAEVGRRASRGAHQQGKGWGPPGWGFSLH